MKPVALVVVLCVCCLVLSILWLATPRCLDSVTLEWQQCNLFINERGEEVKRTCSPRPVKTCTRWSDER